MELRGHLDLLLLATLSRTGPTHGYALITALRDQSDGTFDLPEGTVYPALHRLERDGFVVSGWSTDTTTRRRRVYELTASGIAALADRREQWRAFVRAVEQVARPAAGLAYARTHRRLTTRSATRFATGLAPRFATGLAPTFATGLATRCATRLATRLAADGGI